MRVTSITLEDGRIVQQPTPLDVDLAVGGLDGVTRTMVTLATDGAEHMVVGGGGTRCVVYVTSDYRTLSVLVDPLATGTVALVAGGVADNYPAAETVPHAVALRAARSYALTGRLDPSLNWREVTR
jgi:hypothetical protein